MSAPTFPPPSKKQARILWLSVTALAVGILVGLFGLLMWGFGFVLNIMAPVLWPLAIAGVLSYLFDPVVDFFERKKVKRVWAILLVFFLCLLLVLGFFGSIIPRLVSETRDLIDDFPRYSTQLRLNVSHWIDQSPWKRPGSPPLLGTNSVPAGRMTNLVLETAPGVYTTNLLAVASPGSTNSGQIFFSGTKSWENQVGAKILAWLGDVAPLVGAWVWSQVSRVASWGGMLVGLALVPVFTFYFLLEKQRIRAAWTDYLPVHESKFKDEVVFVINAINNYLIVFFRGQVLVALCDGVLFTIGFLAIGLNYAVLIGFLAGGLSIIPYLGAILTIVPAVILAAVQYHDWLHPVLVVGVFSVVQALEGFVISPKIMGDRVGLHPLTIIVSVLVGTLLLGGILGGVLAIPLTAALRVLMFRYIWKKNHGRNPAPDPTVA